MTEQEKKIRENLVQLIADVMEVGKANPNRARMWSRVKSNLERAVLLTGTHVVKKEKEKADPWKGLPIMELTQEEKGTAGNAERQILADNNFEPPKKRSRK
jgi:hypothetical protein